MRNLNSVCEAIGLKIILNSWTLPGSHLGSFICFIVGLAENDLYSECKIYHCLKYILVCDGEHADFKTHSDRKILECYLESRKYGFM